MTTHVTGLVHLLRTYLTPAQGGVLSMRKPIEAVLIQQRDRELR